MHCSLVQVQPLDSEFSAPSRMPACSSLPTQFLGVGGIFSREPWPSCLVLQAEIVGGQKGENSGPTGQQVPQEG